MVFLLLASGGDRSEVCKFSLLAGAGRQRQEGEARHDTAMGRLRERGPELNSFGLVKLPSIQLLSPEEEMVPRGQHWGSDLQEGRYWELTDGSALADDIALGPDAGLEEPTTRTQRQKTSVENV